MITNPVVLCDAETTGLSPVADLMLELVAMHLDLQSLDVMGTFGRVVHAPHAAELCDDYVLKMHTDNGLLSDCTLAPGTVFVGPGPTSVVENMAELDVEFAAWLEEIGATRENRAYLCGNSVHFDQSFIKRQLPLSALLLSHRVVCVRTAMTLATAWQGLDFSKTVAHRAWPDCEMSLEALKQCKDARG